MIIDAHKDSQRHHILVCSISCVKCHCITKILVGPPAARIAPENVPYVPPFVNLKVKEELLVYCFHLSKKSQHLLHVINVILFRVKCLPTFLVVDRKDRKSVV